LRRAARSLGAPGRLSSVRGRSRRRRRALVTGRKARTGVAGAVTRGGARASGASRPPRMRETLARRPPRCSRSKEHGATVRRHVRACVRACVRAFARVCMRACNVDACARARVAGRVPGGAGASLSTRTAVAASGPRLVVRGSRLVAAPRPGQPSGAGRRPTRTPSGGDTQAGTASPSPQAGPQAHQPGGRGQQATGPPCQAEPPAAEQG
jgi:hypothetical protein